MKSEEFSLEKALSKLQELEKGFQEAHLDLEGSVQKHAEAVGLAKEILSYLENIENKLEKVDIASLSE